MITFKYNCPHCGTENSGFEVRTYYENKKYRNESIFSILATCNTCDRSMISDIKLNNGYDYGHTTISEFRAKLDSSTNYNLGEAYTGYIKFQPNNQLKAEIPENLPDRVIDELKTAEELYMQVKAKPNFIKVSGNAYRTTLERALCELAENDSRARLDKRIENLFKNGKLTEDLKNFALHIRSLSADASHTYNEFSLDELNELRIFTQLFLRYTFTLPAMIPDDSKENVTENTN
ncbi:DUF4145 domain-containing protein [Haemophilus sp. oral taxon 036]|jgi:hypothetical protein|uniref:DUF4145 domain-containing protein n=1 Tax=Haemophilus sp. oral taxon 036 TaxID=712310 RepID=UPI000D0236D4|nr:DUF4145 domain-containing protein [Haemophilus sp. oral taxon 036]AVM59664.1 hypothetical protein C3V42_03045 [Haemophilus sp. oral taxon 036]MDU3900418.1 DUF4145 domain-containing protein [Haemophilus haemolyticus]